MSLSVTLKHRVGQFQLDAAFETAGGVTALFGRSGAGKTSIVNAVAGLLRPDCGRIVVESETLLDTKKRYYMPPHRRRIGYVFQDGRLFPHLSVRQNLLYGAPNGEELAQIGDLLGITQLFDRRPGALSGGEKQRVAIGRALLAKPRMLLMDEPLAALDAPRKAEILPYLERLALETAMPILYVSHSLSEVARLASTIVVLDGGRVVQAGPTSKVLSDPSAAQLLGLREAGSILSARVIQHSDDGLTELSAPSGQIFLPKINAPPGTEVRLRVHAQDIMLALKPLEGISALNMLKVHVTQLYPGEGPGVMVGLDVGGEIILARITRRSASNLGLKPGMKLYAIIKTVAPARDDILAI